MVTDIMTQTNSTTLQAAHSDDVINTDEVDDSTLIARIESEGVKRAADCVNVCNLMATGKSCAQACEIVKIPNSTFHLQITRSQSLAERYARARDVQIDVLMDDLLTPIDYSEFMGPDGRIDPGAVQLFKAQRDDKKWFAAKVAHRRYGDKLELSGDVDNPITVQRIERVIVDRALPAKPDSDEQIIDVSGQNSGQNGDG